MCFPFHEGKLGRQVPPAQNVPPVAVISVAPGHGESKETHPPRSRSLLVTKEETIKKKKTQGFAAKRRGRSGCLNVVLFHLLRKEAFFFFLRFYLFIHERHTHRGRDTGRGRSRLHAGSPMWDLIPGLQDHALG